MTFPDPAPGYSAAPAARPAKLSWVTVPLIVIMVLQVLSIVLLPFLGAALRLVAESGGGGLSLQQQQMLTLLSGGFVWVAVVLQLALLVLYFFVYRAVQAGQEWGRVAAIVLFILNLFSFPIGTLLGIFGLIGAFDAGVAAYCRRRV